MKTPVEDPRRANLGLASIRNLQEDEARPLTVKRQPLVSIIIPNFNGKDFLRECLDSINDLSYRNFEIIVIDNSSIDGSSEMVKKDYPWVRLLVTERMGMAQVSLQYRPSHGESRCHCACAEQ
jgi:cellulose synthase/poly-beta-1,6-N-acetylglucosamine synthase-like glycosyltransferase